MIGPEGVDAVRAALTFIAGQPDPEVHTVTNLFYKMRDRAQQTLAALDERGGGEALEGPIKGSGFDHQGGGFSHIRVGDKTFTADQVRQALAELRRELDELRASGGASREEIARIIDPVIWANRRNLPPGDFKDPDLRIPASLAKADAILALTPRAVGEGEPRAASGAEFDAGPGRRP